MNTSSKNQSDNSKQSLQCVFRLGQEGVASGSPEDSGRACFLIAPDKDYSQPNDFLHPLHRGSFNEHCLQKPQDGMTQRRGEPLRPKRPPDHA